MAHSRLLIVISSGDLLFACFRVLLTSESIHSTQCQSLSFRKHDPHLTKKVSPGNVQSQSVGITSLIGIFQRKAFGN